MRPADALKEAGARLAGLKRRVRGDLFTELQVQAHNLAVTTCQAELLKFERELRAQEAKGGNDDTA